MKLGHPKQHHLGKLGWDDKRPDWDSWTRIMVGRLYIWICYRLYSFYFGKRLCDEILLPKQFNSNRPTLHFCYLLSKMAASSSAANIDFIENALLRGMTNYRIGPDSDHIDPQRVAGISNDSFAALGGQQLIWSQTYKPNQWIRTPWHVLKQRMQWSLTHLPEIVEILPDLVGLKEQMNEADRALIGVEDVHLRGVLPIRRNRFAES